MGTQGVSILLEHSVAKFEVGTKARNPANPAQRVIYVQADDAVTLGNAVTRDFAAAGSGASANVPFLVTTTSAVAQAIVGYFEIAITAGYYAWLVIEGPLTTTVNAATGALEGENVVSTATAGRVDTQPSTAVNPVTTDFDAAVAATGGATVVLTADEAGNVAAAVLV